MRIRDAADRLRRRTVRIGVTGLARAGKTAFLTSLAANLLAGRLLAGHPGAQVVPAPAGASDVPRFDPALHFAALAADPPAWPPRTDAVSLLAFDIDLPGDGLLAPLPPRRLRLELLDYPGEWLLDLAMLNQTYAAWSDAALRRLEAPQAAPHAREFLAFVTALPAGAAGDEALARQGHALFAATLHRLRDEGGLSFLQPGRFLMPPPGAAPPWMAFFPLRGSGGLARLLAGRHEAYLRAVRDDLSAPLFGEVDRLVVLADLLTALGAGPLAFADARDAVAAAAGALRWQWSWTEAAQALLRLQLPPASIGRIAWAATKADHVGSAQRPNLARLLGMLAQGSLPAGDVPTASFAIASVCCTRDAAMTLDGRRMSAVEGRAPGLGLIRSYPGEVPPDPPGPEFWAEGFLGLPQFEPPRLAAMATGVPQLGLEPLLAFLLADVL